MKHRSLLLAPLLLLAPAGADAHSRSVSWSIWRVEGTDVHLYVELTALDALESVPIDASGDGVLTAAEALAGQGLVAGLLEGTVAVRSGAAECAPRTPATVEVPPTVSRLLLRRTWRCPDAVRELRVSLRLHEVIRASKHRNLARFSLPSDRHAQTVFAGSSPDFSVEVDQPPEQVSAWGAFSVYLRLGVEHILTGWDHLLFLLALLLVWPTLARLLAIVTAFTLAHSVTLALAALDVVTLPPEVVEPAIALTIAWVGAENLWVREGRHRWVLTFVFGLIHGFGFAGILRDLGLPRQYLATSLLSFNVGVELGQLAVVAPVWLALRWTLRFPERGRRWAARVVSIGIVVMGLSWFAQRVGWT